MAVTIRISKTNCEEQLRVFNRMHVGFSKNWMGGIHIQFCYIQEYQHEIWHRASSQAAADRSEQKITKLGMNAEKRAISSFLWEKIVKQYISLIYELQQSR